MKGRRPAPRSRPAVIGKGSMLRTPTFWVSVLTLLGIVVFVLGDLGRTAPGPLSSAHERVAALSGFGSCSQCHGGWFGDMTSACLECHEPIEKQIESALGLHGKLGAEQASQCATCHSDHHGPDFSMVNDASFKRAGFQGRDGFDHAAIGFMMAGKHLELACAKCHENADVKVLDEGQRRYLGLSQNCASCHEDPHDGKMQVGCASCHSQTSFDEFQAKDHDRFLSLAGAHSAVTCRDCHGKDTSHSLEAVGGRNPAPARQCLACHDSPHSDVFGRAIAEIVGMPQDGSCKACHDPVHETFRPKDLTVTAEQHAASGFALQKPHDEQKCAECHDPKLAEFAKRYPGRDADGCQACHQDPHGGQFKDSPLATNGCISCHAREHFAPHAFTLEMHAKTRLPLTGSHKENDCEKCHQPPQTGQPRQFRGTSPQCAECHQDAHKGFFDVVAQVKPGYRVSCKACHEPTKFNEVHNFDHARWTKFAIQGAHAQENCEVCHKTRPKADAAGRRFGTVREHFGEFQGCGTCHKDPHNGQFDTAGKPAVVNGRRSCARCHSENSFRSLSADFDHGAWTGFKLAGKHKAADCTSCHAPLTTPDRNGRTIGRAKGKDCASCHETPHAGQFRNKSCGSCHEPTTFDALTFDHELHSRFKLGKRHSKVACNKCHKTEKREGKAFVRYRPMGTQCVDCHAVQGNPLRRRRKDD